MNYFLKNKCTTLLLFCLLVPLISVAQWIVKNNSLNGDFNDIAGYQESHLILATDSGLYSTTNGASTNPTWSSVSLFDSTENNYFQNVEFSQFELYNVTSNTNSFYSCLGYNAITNEYCVYLIDSFNPRSAQRIWTSQPNQIINSIAKSNSPSRQIVILGDNGFVVQYYDGSFFTLDPRISGNLSSGTIGSRLVIIDDGNNRAFVLEEDFSTGKYSYRYVKQLPIGNYNCVFTYGGDIFMYGNTITYFDSNGTGEVNIIDKHFDNLSITTLINGSEFLAASNTGIYFTSNPFTTLERQLSTINQNIVNGSKIGQTNIYYAVGSNQTILRSNNIDGDQLELYGEIFPKPACISNTGSGATFKSGSSFSRSWLVNGVQVFSNNLSYTYDGSASYNLELRIGGANGSQASFFYTQIPSNVPDISMNISASQSNYCLGDVATINIDNTENNILYELKSGNGSSEVTWGEAVGNGGSIQIDFEPTRASENYYVEAKNQNSLCSSDPSALIPISVLRTKADFSYNMVNAYVNEPIEVYNQSQLSDAWFWDFGPNTVNPNSNLENPNVTYTAINNSDITLTATNIAGCSSDYQLPSPNIVLPLAQTSSWNLESGISTGSNNVANYNELLRGLYDTGDGFIIYGRHDDLLLNSRVGQNKYVPDGRTDQVYIAKYDYDGTLKFMLHGTSENGDLMITGLQTDNLGNIIFSSWGNATLDFYDARNKSFSLNNRIGSHIVKLSPKGVFIEAVQIKDMLINDIQLDSQNNVYITGESDSNVLEIFDWLSSSLIDSYTVSSINSSKKAVFLKLNSNYNILSKNTWLFNDSNPFNFNLKIDNNGDLLFYGDFRNELDIVTDNGSFVPIGDIYSWTNVISRFTDVGYIIKMDSSASSVLWKRCFVSINNNSNNTNFPATDSTVHDIVLDNTNNIYAAISNGRWTNGNIFQYDLETMNGNQLLNSTDLGTLVYKAFDTSGNQLWNAGTEAQDDVATFYNFSLSIENNKFVSTYVLTGKDNSVTNPESIFYSPTANQLSLSVNYQDEFLLREYRSLNGELENIKSIVYGDASQNIISINEVAETFVNSNNELFIATEFVNQTAAINYNNSMVPALDQRIIVSKVDESNLTTYLPDNTATTSDKLTSIISFYPNPANNRVFITHFNEIDLKISIFQKDGKLVQNSEIKSGGYINVEELNTGLYFVLVETNGGIKEYLQLIIK